MNRRAFLGLVAKTAAAASLVEVASLMPAPAGAQTGVARGIDWTAWNRIAVVSAPRAPVRWCVNGRVVNGDPAIVQKLARLIRLERDRVVIAGAWHFPIGDDQAESTFLSFHYRERPHAAGATHARLRTLPEHVDLDALVLADTKRHPLPRTRTADIDADNLRGRLGFKG